MDINNGISLITKGFEKIVKVVEDETELSHCLSWDDYSAIHSAVYSLCSDGTHSQSLSHAHSLYHSYIRSWDHYLSSYILPPLRHRIYDGDDHLEVLRWVDHTWRRHSIATNWLSRLLEYLDRCYLRRDHHPGLTNSATISFRSNVFDHVKVSVAAAVAALVRSERHGLCSLEASSVRPVAVDLFVAMGMGELSTYETDLESLLLSDASEFYSRLSGREFDTVKAYMAVAEESIESERRRVSRYLHPVTEDKIVRVVRRELLVSPAARLFEDEASGFLALMSGDDFDAVDLIFRLYLEIPDELRQLAELFRGRIVFEGMEAVRGEEEDLSLIEKLMKIHHRYYIVYLQDRFNGHEFFAKALNEAWREIINAKPAIMVELLVGFCHEILRSGGSKEKMTEDEIEEKLRDASRLLYYVRDKDMFIELHRRNLCDRLLSELGKNIDYCYDKLLLGNIKSDIGNWCTVRQEGMFNDLTIARENDTLFKNYLNDTYKEDKRSQGSVAGKPDLSVAVLTFQRWPISVKTTQSMTVPEEMAKCVEAYTAFYSDTFKSRRLTFIYSLGNCHVAANFSRNKNIKIVVTPYQAAVMILFNDNPELSISEISEQLNINDETLLREILRSLSSAKCNILIEKGNDVYEFNSKFETKKRQLKILPPEKNKTEVEPEKKEIEIKVFESRKYAIDAAIVRVMKARKEFKYQRLLIECTDLLKSKFMPEIKDVKARVESLIERDFIERDTEDANLLRYVA